MHEASLMRGLIRKIDSLAEAENAKQVTIVRVWLGALSHMSPDHFREHFNESSRGTIGEGAILEIEQSSDIFHANAQELLLRSIEVET
jgi:hydrogenase nickel incorporation protein HypA/HybF